MPPITLTLGAEDGCLLARRQLPVGRADLSATTTRCSSAAELAHIKPRLLGHWGTTPGLNFIYVHLNRVIKEARPEHDLHRRPRPRRPGGGGQHLPGRHLQRALSRHFAGRGRLRRLFKQFSFPGGIPSHVAPETPGSIHEGGELGYALFHAYGAVFDNPI
jgi:xylulose-5-phosphate/fructose-6-phosphate phosphoketolase